MKVLLVANYEADRQWSMDRFSGMLLRGLNEQREQQGIEAALVRPAVILGRRNKWLAYVDKFVLFRFALRRAVKARPGCLIHILDQGNAIYAAWLNRCHPSLCVVTLHDLLAIRAALGEFPPHRPSWTGRIFQRLILRGLRKAARLVSVSQATRRDASCLLGKSEVIPNGLEDSWTPLTADQAWPRIELAGLNASARQSGYILHVGGAQWYKNRPGAVRAFIDLRARTAHAPKLVMVGPPLDAALITELKNAGLAGETVVLNGVANDTLHALYSMARVLIFSSLAEGFGWPIIEAQASGCPVIASASEPMRETGGPAAIYAEDGQWSKALADLLEMDATRRAAHIAAGIENARRYSASRMARDYIDFYRRCLE